MEHGLLDEDDAQKALALKQRRSRNGVIVATSQDSGRKGGSLRASQTPPSKGGTKGTKSAAKSHPKSVPIGRKPSKTKFIEESDDDDDVPLTKKIRK